MIMRDFDTSRARRASASHSFQYIAAAAALSFINYQVLLAKVVYVFVCVFPFFVAVAANS